MDAASVNCFHCLHILVILGILLSKTIGISDNMFNLTIIHTSNFHGRFDGVGINGKRCSPEESGTCVGGIARMVTKIGELRAKHKNVILVDSGNHVGPSDYSHVFQGNLSAHYINKLKYDAISLGSHEWDYGPGTLQTYLSQLRVPVVATNYVSSLSTPTLTPGLTSSPPFSLTKTTSPTPSTTLIPSTTVEVGGRRVGILGYYPNRQPALNHMTIGSIQPQEAHTHVQTEARRLVGSGVNIIIALGGNGVADTIVRELVDEVDVLLVGSQAKEPAASPPRGRYGERLWGGGLPDGRALSVLHVTYDVRGDVIAVTQQTTPMDSNVPSDSGTEQELKEPRRHLSAELRKTILSDTPHSPGGAACHYKECVLGDVFTNAMYWFYQQHFKTAKANLALLNNMHLSGLLPKGGVSGESLRRVMTSEVTVDVVRVTSQTLHAMLEHSVANLTATDIFLQIAGARVVYNLGKPAGHRVVCAAIATGGAWVPLHHRMQWNVAMPTSLYNGHHGYKMIHKMSQTKVFNYHPYGDRLVDIVTWYLGLLHPDEIETVFSLNNRTSVVHDSSLQHDASLCSSRSAAVSPAIVMTSVITLIMVVINNK